MTKMRRWALAAAAVVPLSLVSAGVAAAAQGDWPGNAGFSESSATYAGIGGAGTIHSDSVFDGDGNHWTEESAVLAGPTGAAVLHNEEADFDDDYDGWVADAKPGRPIHTHGKRPIAHTDGIRPSVTHHHRPVRHVDHAEVAYTESTKTADMYGATSSHVVSHAGDNHAVYEANDLEAGPHGAVSEGVKAVAKPQYASYNNYYNAAGEDGAVTHEVNAVADATDWNDDHHHYTHHHWNDDDNYRHNRR
ncbi:hypothetical protein [Amycolatopsis regifaucium]|nr:hypothetical protein [Amycolatopsis regifaucium]SFJ71262.1 hypothetical protein SAMN04489731_1333 [Amycolatopsis regifaucium]